MVCAAKRPPLRSPTIRPYPLYRPVNDPTKVTVPTIIMRGQYDGIASLDDLIEFFKLLPNPDKEFAVMPSIAHGSFTQMNYMRAYHILWSFFTRPEPVYQETGSGH